MAGIFTGATSGATAGSAFGPWGTAIGGLVGGLGGLLGGGGSKKAPPTIPYQPVNLQETQQQAISGNQAALPSIDQLLAQSNSFQQGQAISLMNQALPGYSGFASNLLGTASNLAANPYQVPQSVVDQLSQYAAENNIGAGTGAASGFSSSNLLRSLGINALQYGQNNLSAATSALSVLTGTAPRVSPMSPLSFLVTPSQQTQNQQLTNQLQQQIGQAGANAQTAAGNFNSQNLWDNTVAGLSSIQNNPSILQSLLGGLGSNNGSAPATEFSPD